MNEKTLKTTKTVVRLITALSFTLFTAFQVFLAVQLSAQRTGRIIGITFYVLITAASYLVLVHNRVIRVMRSVMFIVAFASLFIMKLFNAPLLFSVLDFSNTPTILYCAVYILSQLGTLIFLVYYLAVRINKKIVKKETVTRVLMTVAIVLFILTLVAECVLIIKYRMNFEYSRMLTLISRFMYFFGFVGTAVNFMLPLTQFETMEDQYINKEQSDADIMLSVPEEKKHSKKDRRRNPSLDDSNLIFSSEGKKGSEPKRRRTPSLDDESFVFSTGEEKRSGKNRGRIRAMDDETLVFSTRDKDSPSDNKGRNPVLDSSDLIFTDNKDSRSHKRKK